MHLLSFSCHHFPVFAITPASVAFLKLHDVVDLLNISLCFTPQRLFTVMRYAYICCSNHVNSYVRVCVTTLSIHVETLFQLDFVLSLSTII